MNDRAERFKCAVEANQAFWAKIAKASPEIIKGDLSHDVVIPFHEQQRNTVRWWLEYNTSWCPKNQTSMVCSASHASSFVARKLAGKSLGMMHVNLQHSEALHRARQIKLEVRL